MPFYEYVCSRCGHEFEQLQKFSDAPLTNCPACHEEGLQKKISAPAFHLKGGGWYVTDFKGGANPKEIMDNKTDVKTGELDKSNKDVNASKVADIPSTDAKVKSETKTEAATDAKPKTSTDEK